MTITLKHGRNKSKLELTFHSKGSFWLAILASVFVAVRVGLGLGHRVRKFGYYNTNKHGPQTRMPVCHLSESLSQTLPSFKQSVVYQEALVHPAMFAHPGPKRVAILGSEATLYEVMKHATVEKVVIFTTLCDQYSVHKSVQCVVDENATAWFTGNYGNSDHSNARFDVIILEDLQSPNRSSISDNSLIDALAKSLGESGIFVTQSPSDDAIEDLAYKLDDGRFGFFDSVFRYKEKVHGLEWNFLVATLDGSGGERWFTNEAEVDLAVKRRTSWMTSGLVVENTTVECSPLLYFDGAMQQVYQYPSRLLEDTFCSKPNRYGSSRVCNHGFDPDAPSEPRSSFSVALSQVSNRAGRGVFAKKFIAAGSYLDLSECVHTMHVPSTTLNLQQKISVAFDDVSRWDVLLRYEDSYGWYNDYYGETSIGVDTGIFTFINHGCNRTYNIGVAMEETEATLKLGQGPVGFFDAEVRNAYDPFRERQFQLSDCKSLKTLKDIHSGDEILDNYLAFGGVDDWEENLAEVKLMCSDGLGSVSIYEASEGKLRRR